MKKSLLQIISANLLYLILVAGNNFLLPKFTSVETYAAVKEYTLYVTTYGTVLTFGYIHGMYLHFGGKELKSIAAKEIGANVASFFLLMLPISIGASMFGVWSQNIVMTALGLGLLSTNLTQYYQMFYQATGDFKSYGTALNASRVLVLVVNMFLIFVCKTDNKVFYVGISPMVGIGTAVYLTIKLNNKIPFLRCFRVSFAEIKRNICSGFVLMLGEFASRLFTSIDRWFVNGLLGVFHFAMYSFAVSMENLVNTFMTPVTVSMYNFFCKKPDVEEIRKVKDITLIYSMVIIAGAFPCKWILENFITEYLPSAGVMFFLFASQGISAVIRGIYVNKYKADGEQKKYLRQMMKMLALAVLLNCVFFYIGRNIESIAAATLLTNLIWLIQCEIETPELRYNGKTITACILLIAVYMFAGQKLNAFAGAALYCFAGVALGMTLMKDRFLFVLSSLRILDKNKSH